ncbi:MAG: hypothetical protein KGI25_07910, partial [Thaumarchaeota archaeon]|nr:hypothetical protein [Nitrososphaerota archaeon]
LRQFAGTAFKIDSKFYVRSRTGRGDTHIDIQISDPTPGRLLDKKSEKLWREKVRTIELPLYDWLKNNNLLDQSRITFTMQKEIDAKQGQWVKIKEGILEVRLLTRLITSYYKKLGVW